MTWPLSLFGEQLAAPSSGINELMRDLGEAMAGRDDLLMLGGGNPAHIPAVDALWVERWRALLDEPGAVARVLGNYDAPQGSPVFLEALAESLRAECGWEVGPANIAVVNGSQTAFFYLFNLLAGRHADGSFRSILLPLAPEYIGYADQGLAPGMFRACPPRVELIGDHRFKYHIDFDRLVVDDRHAAICVSRPTNPSGNVLTDEEMSRLAALAESRHIPLLVDNAYGAPFPGILFRDITPVWNDRMVMVMSLSKLGLPGTRTGLVIANEDLIESISATHAVAGLANGNIGQAIATPLLRDRSLFRLRDRAIRPFYQRKSNQAVAWLLEALDDRLPFRIHVNEGALFLWVWFDDLPITAQQLYERLKARNVLIIPGHPFFYGLEEEHPHQHRCIRLSYAQSDAMVEQGIAILAEEVARAYAGR